MMGKGSVKYRLSHKIQLFELRKYPMANSSKAPLQSKDMKPLAWRIYLLLVTVEGIVAFILMHKVRSMERSAVLWGYSLPRVVLGLTMALVLIALFAITIKSILD
jgi:hypothetical protein